MYVRKLLLSNFLTCIEILCGPPPEVLHGSPISVPNVSDQTNFAGSRRVYQCDLGYEFEEDDIDQLIITCQEDGNWETPKECQRTYVSTQKEQ